NLMPVFLEENRYFYEGLTRHNYFPNQKDSVGELPPCFSTSKYTPEVVEMLSALDESTERKKLGYDHVEYLVTRHNNVPRTLGLIHPKAYALLAKAIYENWDKLKIVKDNENSIIKPGEHVDGRIMIMNYEDAMEKARASLNFGFGKRFRVHSDISSCFHSIYTHSIPWAAIGFDQAKLQLQQRRNTPNWYDDIDKYQRKAKRNETQGIPIGPATSSVIVEYILGGVDRALVDSGFVYRRYIDDYVCYCETDEQAQRFIRLLSKELSVYKLNINLHKTKVVGLPEPLSDDWVTTLAGALPTNFIDADHNRRKLLHPEIVHYLDAAVRLNKLTPDGSVIKYAVGSIIHHISDYAVEAVLDYVINLSWHYPVLLPHLELLLDSQFSETEQYASRLNNIISENARNRRSDGMAWPLYYLKKYGLPITNEAFAETLKSEDCIALLCLYETGRMVQHVVDFAYSLLCEKSYRKDKYWLLLYQLYLDGLVADPYGDGVFELLKEHDVDFIVKGNGLSKSEEYCQYLACPFLAEEKLNKSFEEWSTA
ncbi:MAG: antiviral reverse transcriptase Drt4, partial [Porticoccus sp.]